MTHFSSIAQVKATLYGALAGLVLAALCLVLPTATPAAHASSSGAELHYAPAAGVITSTFGWRSDPFLGTSKFHTGLDIAAPTGTPVHSADSGVVVYSQLYAGYGNVVVVKHANGLFTLYAHNDRLLVKKGDYVATGQPLSLIGSTGRATGPHLHFEVHYNSHYVDPKDYLLYRQSELVAMGELPSAKQGTLASAPTPLPPAIGGPVTNGLPSATPADSLPQAMTRTITKTMTNRMISVMPSQPINRVATAVNDMGRASAPIPPLPAGY
jgi:murein DD-endopeptidase MepM/ murein hydrolase activator NlpD